MTEHVRITDVSPRDGLQNEPGVVSTCDKVKLIELLAASGVDEIEAASFVSPKWVPQLGDAEAVLTALRSSELFMPCSRFGDGCSHGAGAEPSPSGRGQGEGAPSIPRARDYDDRSEFMRDRARLLRRRQTTPEKLLWSKLRDRRFLDLKFRRQASVGPYVVDFFCDAFRLVIEIDGRSHYGDEAHKKDAQREASLRERGFTIVRYTNDQILQDMDAVLMDLKTRIEGGWADRDMEKKKAEEPLTPALSRGERESDAELLTPALSVLVPNEKGYERALAFHSEQFPLKIAVFTAASQTFNTKNTNATIEESIARFGAFLPDAIERGMAVRLYVSCAIACPYEGRIEAAAVRGVCDQLLSLVPTNAIQSGAVELDLGDTIGAATPDDIERLLDVFTLDERSCLTVHLHDTFGRAADCVRTALEMGVRSFDGSVAGLGGCPYAGTKEKPAPGNISTETLLKVVEEAGYRTRVDRAKLAEASAFANAIVRSARQSPGITPL